MAQDFIAQTPQDFYQIWDKEHISNIAPSQVRHNDLKNYLEKLKAKGVPIQEVGKSVAGREIYQMEFGKGSLKIFMWSQMHGDEPTATSALIDMFSYLYDHSKDNFVKDLAEKVTIRAVPMLNPDGAELYQRRNLQFIDINRDAVMLQTPEGRLLKKLRDDWKPEIGFNLHNQNPLTTVGNTTKQATISLLAVSGSPDGKSNGANDRNKRLCAVMIAALNTYIKGNIGRYDDGFNPRAFGDNISRWGTQVILIETGGSKDLTELQLVQLNFLAYLSALKALVDGSEKKANPNDYDSLPYNTNGNLYSLIIRHAQIVNRYKLDNGTVKPFMADIALVIDTRRSNLPPLEVKTAIQDIGDLSVFEGVQEVDASEYYVVAGKDILRVGVEGDFLFYRKDRKIDFSKTDLENEFPPDAIYRNGGWVKKGKLNIVVNKKAE
jgi:hypothetical protein